MQSSNGSHIGPQHTHQESRRAGPNGGHIGCHGDGRCCAMFAVLVSWYSGTARPAVTAYPRSQRALPSPAS